jgi:AGCS family alanine or glycine:cation symporter
MGAALTVLALAVVFGGIHRIAKVSSAVVPLMAVVYLLLAVGIIVTRFDRIPLVMEMILENAFGVGPFAGGTLGTIVMMGVKRGLFSNEAGEGSAPNAAATAAVSHPVKQGLVQALGVYTDTLVVCSCTAFIILCSGVDYTASNGIQLTQDAMQAEIGQLGNPFVAVMIWLFAFSTIIANCYYGESNLLYFTKSRVALMVYRLTSCGCVMLGALMSLDLTWSLIDLCMALITICNLSAIILLFPKVRYLTRDYLAQKRAHRDPSFHKSQMPDIAEQLEGWG